MQAYTPNERMVSSGSWVNVSDSYASVVDHVQYVCAVRFFSRKDLQTHSPCLKD